MTKLSQVSDLIREELHFVATTVSNLRALGIVKASPHQKATFSYTPSDTMLQPSEFPRTYATLIEPPSLSRRVMRLEFPYLNELPTKNHLLLSHTVDLRRSLACFPIRQHG